MRLGPLSAWFEFWMLASVFCAGGGGPSLSAEGQDPPRTHSTRNSNFEKNLKKTSIVSSWATLQRLPHLESTRLEIRPQIREFVELFSDRLLGGASLSQLALRVLRGLPKHAFVRALEVATTSCFLPQLFFVLRAEFACAVHFVTDLRSSSSPSLLFVRASCFFSRFRCPSCINLTDRSITK